MIEQLTTLFVKFSELSKQNPMLAAFIGAWGLGVATFIFRGVPTRLWNIFVNQTTTSLDLTNSSRGSNYETFIGLMEWYATSRWARWSRSFMLDGIWKPIDFSKDPHGSNDHTIIGVGLGSHYFFYKRRLFRMRRSMLDKTGSYEPQYQIHLTMLGRKKQVLEDLVSEFSWKPGKSEASIFHFHGPEGWSKTSRVVPRHLESVIVSDGLKDEIMRTFEHWEENREWYYHRGLPYKLTMLLEGPPGTGKTSLIRALASHYGRNLAIIQLNEMSDQGFVKALQSVPPNSFIVMEDFDDAVSGLHRKNLKDDVRQLEQQRAPTISTQEGIAPLKTATAKAVDPAPSPASGSWKMITLSGILNALDGLVVLDGQVIIMTTNVVREMDPALIRPGRIDRRYHLGYLKDADVREYIRVMFPEDTHTVGGEFADIPGSELMKHYVMNPTDIQAFIDCLPRKEPDFTSTLSP